MSVNKTLDVYTFEVLPSQIMRFVSNNPEDVISPISFDTTVTTIDNQILLPSDLEVRFEIEEFDFESLTDILRNFETEFGISSIEMFRRFKTGSIIHTDQLERWFEYFVLYLGTSEIKEFSCP